MRGRLKAIVKGLQANQTASLQELQEMLQREQDARGEAVGQVEELEHEVREMKRLLEEAQEKIDSLTQSEATKASDLKAQELKMSILSEIETELQNRKADPRTQAKQRIEQILPQMAEDLSPAENYFYLTGLAAKISLTMQYSIQPGGDIFIKDFGTLKMSELYDRAIDEQVEFHEWYAWIQKQFTGLAEKHRAEVDAKYAKKG